MLKTAIEFIKEVVMSNHPILWLNSYILLVIATIKSLGLSALAVNIAIASIITLLVDMVAESIDSWKKWRRYKR